MPLDPTITPYAKGEVVGASRLNQTVNPVNRLLREFNERDRVPGLHVPRFAAFKVLSAVPGQSGRYYVEAYIGPLVSEAVSELKIEDFGEKYSDDPDAVIMWFTNDIGTGSHALPSDFHGVGVVVGVADLGKPIIVFSGGGGALPKGQYQFMVYQNVSQNQVGFDWLRAHPMP